MSPGSENIALLIEKAPPDWSAWLDGIWTERYCGHPRRVHQALRDLGLPRPYTLAGLVSEVESRGWPSDLAIELALLEVSLRRRELAIESAENLALEIAAFIGESQAERYPQLWLQRGLNALNRVARDEALQYFSHAVAIARQPHERWVALFNQILCLEDLGFDYREPMQLFEESFKACASPHWRSIFGEQILAMQARDAYRRADTDRLGQLLESADAGEQSAYYLHWVACLPHFQLPGAEKFRAQAVQELTERLGDQLTVPYNTRTLSGLFIEKDLSSSVRATEQIERLYLWLWRWLLAPQAQSLEAFLSQARAVFANTTGVLCADEQAQLGLVWRWLHLIAGTPTEPALRLPPGAQGVAPRPVPVLDYESLILDLLRTWEFGGNNAVAERRWAVEDHPLHKARGFYLSDFFRDFAGLQETAPAFRSLVLTARGLRPVRPVFTTGILLECSAGIARCFRGEQVRETRHEAMTRLWRLASTRDVISTEEAFCEAFGFRRYDPEIHLGKLAKLLTQANREGSGLLRLSRRGNHIHVERTAPIQLEGTPLHRQLLRGSPQWPLQDAQTQANAEAEILISRLQVQRILDCGKSHAAQLISVWLTEGRIRAIGSGRTRRYQLSDAGLRAKFVSLHP